MGNIINQKSVFRLSDASSSNEAVHLQQRLKSLSTELLVMRNRLHVESQGHGRAADVQHHGIAGGAAAGVAVAGSKAANYDLNASSPNLNLGTGGLSANALQQHANGSGQNTLSKVSSYIYTYIERLLIVYFNCRTACVQLQPDAAEQCRIGRCHLGAQHVHSASAAAPAG